MAYIDRDFLEMMLSDDQIQSLLDYGNNTNTTEQDQKVDFLCQYASDVVDSYLYAYDLPLASVPHSIKMATYWLTIEQLYTTANQTVPEDIKGQIQDQYGYLRAIRDKNTQLPGLSQNTTTGKGGNLWAGTLDTDGESERLFSPQKLKGTFI